MGLVTLLSFMACIVLQCNCFGIERRSTLALLDNDNLNKLDHEVRREMLVMIINKIKQKSAEHKMLSSACDAVINASIASCKACQKDICTAGSTDVGTKVVEEIKHVGSSISHAFHHVFGKRCTQSCPICAKIDIKTHSKEQVLRSVCGSASITTQQEDIRVIKSMQTLYNNTLTNHVVTKIEYDPASIKTAGVISFASNYATYLINGKTVRFHSSSDLQITDITATAKSLAHQIWAKI